MVTGSVASSIHGIPRSTNDLDIVIAPTRQQLRSLIGTFTRLGYCARWEDAENALLRRDRFNVIDFPNAEDVLIAKLEWMKIRPSDRQLEDAAGIVTVQRLQLDWPYIEKWISELGLQAEWQAVREAAEVD